jgi:ABC-2 type transport system permease protein
MTVTRPRSGPAGTTAAISLTPTRSTFAASRSALWALVLRDLVVLRKHFAEFVVRTIIQPFLLVFVFLYVFPTIGQGIGGGHGPVSESAFATVLVAGVVGISIMFQGIQAVALQLSSEFGYTREIEDRVLAPLPVWAVAMEKIVSGALQALIAGAIVFPLAAVVPATAVHLHVNWLTLLAVSPLAALTGATLGLALGTRVRPEQVPLMFSVIVIPITFLGATYYPWARLTPIPWLKWAVLVNPLVYMSEGFRMALTPVAHMPGPAVYAALVGFVAVLGWLGIDGFRRRVLA